MRKLISLSLAAVSALFIISCDEALAPQTDFEYTIDGNTVTFNNLTAGDVSEYIWQFGDGNTSNDQNPVHEYEKGGDYLVTLLARNDNGAKEETKTITIEGGGDNAVTLPTIPGTDAALVAVNNKTFTEQGGFSIEIEIGIAAAVFFDAQSNYVDVGTVSVNDNDLEKNSSNYYSYTNTGDGFSSPVNWKVAGGGDFTAIDQTVSLNFPGMGQINSGNVIIGDDYNLTMKAPITDADSVIIVITGGSSSYQSVIPNNNSDTYAISGANLQNIGTTTTGIVSVSAYNYLIEDIGGKKIGFATQSNVTKTIEVQ